MTVTLIIIGAILSLLGYAGIEKLRQVHTERQDVGSVSVTLTVDTTAFTEGMSNASRAVADMGVAFGQFKEQVGYVLLPALQRMRTTTGYAIELWQIRVETKWRIRGEMYATLGWPDSCVNEEVQAALTEELLFPYVAAAAFLKGWVEFRPEDPELVAARALGLDPHPMYDELVTS